MNDVKKETFYMPELDLLVNWNTVLIFGDTDESKVRELNRYIDLFINDKLSVKDTNFLKFSVQKDLTIDRIKNTLAYSPRELILHNFAYDVIIGDYLFVHSLVALEHLGYLEIKSIELEKARIFVKDKFFGDEEIDTGLLYQGGTLYFNKKKIVISKSENNEQHLFLNTIFSDKEKLWDFDEIAEHLQREYDPKNDWNKYYQTGQKINSKIKYKTDIPDFVDITTKTARINRKYLF